jgi:ComF family protein
MGGQYIEPVLFSRLFTTAQSLPGLCAVCHAWGRQRLCADCLTQFARATPRCMRCALAVPTGVRVCGSCLADPPPFERAVTAFDYSHPWDGLITRFKFHAALDLAPALAARLAAAVRRSDVPHPSLLLPVPLSASRLHERGYNQAWELARRLGRLLNCPAEAGLLLRIKDGPHQLALPRERRSANVRDAFAVEPLRRNELRGRGVALIDDVMTTGATAAEASRVLLQAGAASVQVWVVGRTPRPEDR